MILYDSEVICVFMSDYCVQGTVLDAEDKEANVRWKLVLGER